MTLIGIMGEMGSGKDTAAQILVERAGFSKVALADPIKEFCAKVFGWSSEQLWGESNLRNAPDKRYPLKNGFNFPEQVTGASWYPVGDGSYTLVDTDDLARVSEHGPWYVSGGYIATCTGRDTHLLHRLLINCHESGLSVDHVNGDRLDNRKKNLRIATPAQNAANSKPRKKGSSPFKGVCWAKKPQKWVAQICKDGKRTTIGEFLNEVDAAMAYDKRANELFGEYARTNADCFLTPRYALQTLGTQWGRQLHPDIWVRYLLDNLPSGKVVVSDLRFRNEVDRIRERGGWVIKIARAEKAKTAFSGHASETEQASIPDSAFDLVINNDGTIDDLRKAILDFEGKVCEYDG